MGKYAKTCKFPYCQTPEDLGRECGLCSQHTERWIQSDAFREAAMDENVRACFALGLEKQAMREIAKHRRRWAKAEAAREEESA